MYIASLIDYRPPGKQAVPGIAWVIGSPASGEPARWKATRDWKTLSLAGVRCEAVAAVLDVLVASLSQRAPEEQVAWLRLHAGTPLDGDRAEGITINEPQVGTRLSTALSRYMVASLARDDNALYRFDESQRASAARLGLPC